LAADRSVDLDADVVDLALVNLFSNVEKYVGRGGNVQVSSRQTNTRTTIDVIDDGPGVKRLQASKIFQPFVRVDDSINAPAGTGLGLSIARNAARRHGGDLTLLTSKSGCHFRLIIAH
jgi:signal transduction histidine kinase